MKHILFYGCLLLNFTAATAQRLDWASTINDTIQVFSSPRCADLNGDGIKDAVIGAGREPTVISPKPNLQLEFHNNSGIIALDGSNGAVLWTVITNNQMYGSPIFEDITGDNKPEVFIGGRSGNFLCINGATGQVLWNFLDTLDTDYSAKKGWYNFFNPQLIDDVDGDGKRDLLTANGGDHYAAIFDNNRPPAVVCVFSSSNGALLARDTVPDLHESYMSPLVADLGNDGIADIIFGTGGESFGGSLWRVPLPDLLNNDISNAILLISRPDKGFIAPPLLADMNNDNIADIVVNSYDAHTYIINGANNQIIWEKTVAGAETNAPPAIGHFNNDNIPDIFVNVGIGLAPTFLSFRQLVYNGSNGNIEWQSEEGAFQFNAPLCFDADADGIDEVLWCTNLASQNGIFSHRVELLDFNDNTKTTLAEGGGANIVSTPWIGDMNDDKLLDMLFIYNPDSTTFVLPKGMTMEKYSLNLLHTHTVPLNEYMGYQGKGTLAAVDNCLLDMDVQIKNIACEGVKGGVAASWQNNANAPYSIVWDYQVYSPLNSNNFIRQNLETGTYRLAVYDNQGCAAVETIVIENEAITATWTQSDADTYQIYITGGAAPYKVYINENLHTAQATGGTEPIIADMSETFWNLMVEDSNGCSFETSVSGETDIQTTAAAYQLQATATAEYCLSWEQNKNVRLQIFDLQGKLLHSYNAEGNRVQLSLNEYVSGMYIIQLKENGTNKTLFSRTLIR